MLRYNWRSMTSLVALLTLGLLWPVPVVLAADSPPVVTQTLTYTLSNGQQYTGTWQEGKRHGQGTLTYPNGDTYVGAWQDDKRQGQGTYAMHDGQQYMGEWQDDKPNG